MIITEKQIWMKINSMVVNYVNRDGGATMDVF
jgi:hypothetical protein